MSDVFQDFKNQKLFLEQLGLSSFIKTEKSVDSGAKSESVKLSLNEIIVIDDDDTTANNNNVTISNKSKLLFNSNSFKSSKPIDFTRSLRGRSKKLLMLPFSSPLGRKIDFTSGSGKAAKNKSFLECVDSYEKWCSTDINKLLEEERKSIHKSSKIGRRGESTYNFRRRSKRISKPPENELLLRSMKSCTVNLLRIDDCDLSKHLKTCNTSDPITSTEKKLDNLLEINTPTSFENSISVSNSQCHDDDEVLINGVYSLAPGVSPDLPPRLLEVGQNLVKSQASKSCHPQSASRVFSTLLPLPSSTDLSNVHHSNENNTHSHTVIGREGRNINIIDLCGVENEDCYMIDSGSIRSSNGSKTSSGQPLQQVTPYHFTVDKVVNKDISNPSDEVKLLSFLCKICNEIIKCRGFYKTDMVRHYAVEHNIANVNLVSHVHNGKIVWKVVEEPTCFTDGNSKKSRKLKRSNNSFSEYEQAKKLIHIETNDVPGSGSDGTSINEKQFINSHKILDKEININMGLNGPNRFSDRISEVICID